MKSSKEGNLLRLIAIFLVAVTLVFTVGFAADGMGNSQDGNTQGGTDGVGTPEIPEDSTPQKLPDYLCYLTGLEITKESSESEKICYVIDSSDSLYGISSSIFTLELPTEDGKSRILAYIDENVKREPKIGSITKTRDYISNVLSFFGGTLISSGNDDKIAYSAKDVTDSVIDLTGHVGYYYTENANKIYTNKNLVEALLLSRGISASEKKEISMPFVFNGYFSAPIKSSVFARTVTLQYGEENTTKFSYSAEGKYSLTKNGTNIIDTTTGGLVSYENVFVLFTDATTYEKIDSKETVLDTITSGVGYYFTAGTKFDIRWYCDEGGSLVFLNDSGERLTVNRGRSYIAYAKATMYGKLLIES